ncbi:MAG: PEP-CTERM sorting domain-containing protein [Phycisphaeraceae bacterium]|nr:PEP-CTERM sorting domain-containing protein [Phycisphaeraceae bacterium]
MKKACLFGGTLLAAGMTSSANSQVFSFTYSAIRVGAYAYGVSGPSYDGHYGPGFWSVAASEPGALATSDGTPSLIDMTATSDTLSGAFAAAFVSYFTVSADTVATASWDYTGGFALTDFIVHNVTDGVDVLFVSGGGTPPGTAPVPLEAGKDYRLSAWPFATGGLDGTSFARLEVPAPSSLALLGLGGLVATRRRR